MIQMKKKIIIPVIVSALTVTVVIISVAVFLNFGSWLIVSDPVPERLDIIFTFAGDGARVTYSKELAMIFPEARWILSDYQNGHARLLRKSNYDMSRVAVVDTCRNTRAEIRTLIRMLGAGGPEFVPCVSLSSSGQVINVGLVSSPYHMRRIQLMVKKYHKEGNYRFMYLPVPMDRYQWSDRTVRNWWKSAKLSKAVISEAQKILYFFLIS